jgi:hypothetical protein
MEGAGKRVRGRFRVQSCARAVEAVVRSEWLSLVLREANRSDVPLLLDVTAV